MLPKPKNQHYLDRYIKLINICLTTNFDGYTENHHILPKSMGGNNSKQNLVTVTPRIHFILHYLLYKAYQTRDMAYALKLMSATPKNYRGKRYFKLSSKQYQYFRVSYSNLMSGSNNPNYGKTKKRTVEQVERNRQAQLGISKGKGKKLSDNHRKKLSEVNSGNNNYNCYWNIINVKDNTVIVVDALYSFCKNHNIPYHTAVRYAKLDRIYCGTYKFIKFNQKHHIEGT